MTLNRDQTLLYVAEDRFDFASYNRIVWEGLMGNNPYPAAQTGMDLRQNRGEILSRYKQNDF
jgi:hypothetical protein